MLHPDRWWAFFVFCFGLLQVSATNILVHDFYCTWPTFLLSEHLGIELLQHHMYMYMQLYQMDLQSDCINSHTNQPCFHTSFVPPPANIFILAIQHVCLSHDEVSWWLIRLNTSSYIYCIDHFYILLSDTHSSLLPFFNWVVGLRWLICRSSLCIWFLVLCYFLYVANLFSHFVACLSS